MLKNKQKGAVEAGRRMRGRRAGFSRLYVGHNGNCGKTKGWLSNSNGP